MRAALLKRGRTIPNPAQRVTLGALIRLTDLNPLLRNDNTVSSPIQNGIGPHGIVRKDDGTFEMLVEAYSDIGGVTNNGQTGPMHATGPVLQGPWTITPSTMILTPGDTSTWEYWELSPQNIIWDPLNSRYFITVHGGNNQGPRQIGYIYSANGKDLTSLIRDPRNPIFTPGASGALDDNWLADLRLARNPWTGRWVGLYRGQKVGGPSDGSAMRVEGPSFDSLVKTSGGISTAPGWATNGYHVGDLWYDAGGRLHHFGASGSLGIGYDYSDDDGLTFTSGNGGAAVLVPTGVANTPDKNSAGGTLRLVDDGDVLFLTYHASNLSDAVNSIAAPFRGPCAAITPAPKVSPARPGKFYSASAYTDVPSTALLTQTVFSLMFRFRAYRINRTLTRMIYAENVSGGVATKKFQLQMNANNGGKVQAFYRTPTTSVTINSLAAVDDALWHTGIFCRTATNAFELVIDGVSQGTSALDPTTDATAVLKCFGNAYPGTGLSDSPFNGTISDLGVVTGYAATNAEAAAWIANRTALGGGTVVFDSKTGGTDNGNVILVEAA